MQNGWKAVVTSRASFAQTEGLRIRDVPLRCATAASTGQEQMFSSDPSVTLIPGCIGHLDVEAANECRIASKTENLSQ